MLTDDDLENLFYDPDSDTLELFPLGKGGSKKSGGTVEDEPKDNVGRKKCWWCHRPTTLKPLFSTHYEYCEKCKK